MHMMRIVKACIVGMSGVLILGVLFFLALPLRPGVQAQTGSDEQAQDPTLELAVLYENHGLLKEAREVYEQAVLDGRYESANAAVEGMRRVLDREHSPMVNLQVYGRNLLLGLARHGLGLVAVLGVAWVLYLLLRLIPKRHGFQLVPFKDHTGNKLGSLLADCIYMTIQRVRFTHCTDQGVLYSFSEHLSMPGLAKLPETPEESAQISSLASVVSALGPHLQTRWLEPLLQRCTGLWRHTLTGRFLRFGSETVVEAHLIDAQNGRLKETWTAEMPVQPQDEDLTGAALELGTDIAYQILYSHCSQPVANSWESLKYLTEAMQAIQKQAFESCSLRHFETAVHKLETALCIDPGYSMAKYYLGIAYMHLGRNRQALRMFQDLQKTGRFRLAATYNMGVAYYHYFQDWASERAIQEFERLLGDLDKNPQTPQRSLLCALAYCGLANAKAQQMGSSGADTRMLAEQVQSHVDNALRIGNDDHCIRAMTHVAQGIALLHSEQSSLAADAFQAAIALRPDYFIAYIYLSKCYSQTDNLEEAMVWIEAAIRLNPDYQYAHYVLGKLYSQQGLDKQAMESYSRAPQIARAQNALGMLLAKRGQFDKALASFHEAMALNSKLAEAYSNHAWFTIEAGIRDPDALQNAMESAKRAVQLNRGTPYEWHSYDVLGRTYLYMERLAEAEEALLYSVTLDSTRAQNRFHLALLYQQKGDVAVAREVCTELLKIVENKDAWWQRAVALVKELDKEQTQ
jgi:tetratricopeptide (TPR) repeat protein